MANKEKAKAELVELDVREVSIVDQPANKRRFLIVKRRDGSAIEPTEDEEMRRAIPASERDSRPGVVRDAPRAVQKTAEEEEDTSILDLFGGDEDEGDPTDDDQGDDDRATEGDPEPTEVVTKKTIEALRGAVSSWLGGLNAAAATLKEIGDGEAPADLMAKLQSAAVGMASLVGEEVSKFAESAKAAKVFEAVTTAVGALSKAAAALKGEEPAAEVVDLIKSAAKALTVEAEGEQQATEEPPPAVEPKPQPAKVEKVRTEIFVSHREDGNHHVIIKRGAKMRKTNLAKLRNAVRMLSELLKEVGGSEEEKRVETTKQIEEVVKSTVDQATSKLTEAFNAKLEEITKALQGAEVPTSQSEGEDENTTPPTEIQKGRNLWGSFFKGLTH